MPQSLDVTAEQIVVDPSCIADLSSVDVELNGHRVWSIDLISTDEYADGQWEWPRALQPYLDGTARIDLRDSATGELRAGADVHLGTKRDPIDVVDDAGRRLAVNKWGRLGKSFAGSEDSLRDRILDRLDELVAFCEERDLRPFILAGTLLGAVRAGKVLPHDDDADLGYLSRHTHPSDVSLESYQIERDLKALGIEVFRHSGTHLQLTWRRPDGSVDAYVDLFGSFFRPDGTLNQPFHCRGPVAESEMLPFSTVTLEGRQYPAPANPECMLLLNYGESWRTPLPGWKLHTPPATRRRFRAWLGSFNADRDFWEAHYSESTGDDIDTRAAERLHEIIPAGEPVLELGCGSGESAIRLAELGHPVTAVDVAPAAVARARQLAEEAGVDVDLRRLNLFEFRHRAELLALVGETKGPRHVLIGHLLERVRDRYRPGLYQLVRAYLRAGARVVVALDTQLGPDFDHRDPVTWHLEMGDVKQELRTLGLDATKVRPLRETERDRQRGTVLFEIALQSD